MQATAALQAKTSGTYSKMLIEAAIFLGLLSLSILIRHYGDRAPDHLITPYLQLYYPNFLLTELPSLSWWELFLPLPQLKGTWSTTGFLLNHALETTFGSPQAHYILVATSAIAFYGFLRVAFGSAIISTIGVSFLIFSRYNEHIYIVSGSNNTYNLTLFSSIVGLFGLDIWKRGLTAFNSIGFFLAVIASALSYEAWINLALSILWGCFAISIFNLTTKHSKRQLEVTSVAIIVLLVLVAYVTIRSQYSTFTFRAGTEAELLTRHLNANEFGIAIDDALNNVMLNLMMTAMQVLPAGFGTSAHVIMTNGNVDVIAITSGYLKSISENIDWMMQSHYWTIWRFWAGAMFAIGLMATVRWARMAWVSHNTMDLAKLCLIVPIMMGSPSHALLKVVHWTTWPHTPYKISVSMLFLIVLVCLLLSEALATMTHAFVRRAVAAALVAYTMANFMLFPRIYNAHIRFAWGDSGLFHQGFYPDPISGLERSWELMRLCRPALGCQRSD